MRNDCLGRSQTIEGDALIPVARHLIQQEGVTIPEVRQPLVWRAISEFTTSSFWRVDDVAASASA